MTADRLIAGRYRLTDPIGTGAMGVVWRATDVRLRRTVAVKQLLLGPGLSRSAALEAKLRAMREGRIAARLHHPNAITVFDVAEEDGQPWLVMEYMDAPSLAAKLSGKRTLAPTEVAKIGAQAASALAAAHAAGIMHRDVKPANLLVGDDGTVKITDFGISRAVGDVTVTATGFLAGTPAYLAPEVARGEDPEPASDVFALGSTLYTAVQGSPPFGEGDNPLAVLHAVARARVQEPERAGVLGPVLMRLLAPTVDARPTMREAKEALEAVAAGREPGLAPPVLTKVMPAPGATAILPQSGAAGSTDRPSDTATAVVPAALAGPYAPHPVSAQPPIPPQGGTTLPSGTSGPERGRIAALAAAAVLVVLIAAGIIATMTAGNGEEGAPRRHRRSCPRPRTPRARRHRRTRSGPPHRRPRRQLPRPRPPLPDLVPHQPRRADRVSPRRRVERRPPSPPPRPAPRRPTGSSPSSRATTACCPATCPAPGPSYLPGTRRRPATTPM